MGKNYVEFNIDRLDTFSGNLESREKLGNLTSYGKVAEISGINFNLWENIK